MLHKNHTIPLGKENLYVAKNANPLAGPTLHIPKA